MFQRQTPSRRRLLQSAGALAALAASPARGYMIDVNVRAGLGLRFFICVETMLGSLSPEGFRLVQRFVRCATAGDSKKK